MRIGILGTGNMAASLGGAWVGAAHEVVIGGRDPVQAAAVAGRIGAAGHGTLADAAGFGEAVLVAVPAGAVAEVVAGVAGQLAGRAVIDCTNPLRPTADGLMLTPASVPRSVPGAHLVKAFNLCHESIWTQRWPVYEGQPLVVPFCADDAPAVAVVDALITSIGCTPAHCGGLVRAGYLEATAALAIGMWFAGAEPRWAFPSPSSA
ncbi:NADPH-dependent F420 reductase [Dactylosporangium siamense]|uniref:NADP oxidoreductase n=1 Tax=Dactylosporangium siamense TaxID=685454 RepID=A0A919PMF8_9ACTN|nr:NAD(P)-binding domain-containing protein [Dactylosporangium siamense]GIG44813.1 NADP oxidoreductase [Dactylosporangium siamense]